MTCFSDYGTQFINKTINLTALDAKAYNALLLNRIRPEIEKIPRKTTERLSEESLHTLTNVIRLIIEEVRAKNLEATLQFVDFSKAIDCKHRGKIMQILLAYGLPKETLTAIMILYKNTKAMIRSPDRETDDFDIDAGVLQEDPLARYLFILYLDNVLRTLIDLLKEMVSH